MEETPGHARCRAARNGDGRSTARRATLGNGNACDQDDDRCRRKFPQRRDADSDARWGSAGDSTRRPAREQGGEGDGREGNARPFRRGAGPFRGVRLGAELTGEAVVRGVAEVGRRGAPPRAGKDQHNRDRDARRPIRSPRRGGAPPGPASWPGRKSGLNTNASRSPFPSLHHAGRARPLLESSPMVVEPARLCQASSRAGGVVIWWNSYCWHSV